MSNCEACGQPTSSRVEVFSRKKYGRVICMTCQTFINKDNSAIKEEPIEEKTPVENNNQMIVDKNAYKISDNVKPFIKVLQGKDFIMHAGLLMAAHELGLLSIETEMVSKPGEEPAVFKATVKIDNKENTARIFTCYGDASTKNVNAAIAQHYIRMAETRAINRALRLATNIGMTSSEEMSD